MKAWIALLMAGALVGSAYAADTSDAPPGISAKGDGRWEVLCHAYVKGEMRTAILRPGQTRYSDPRMVRAECSYRAGSEGTLTATVAGADTCPFSESSAEACAITVSAGQGGSFKFRVKGR